MHTHEVPNQFEQLSAASEIVDHIAKGEWKAVNVIDAYIARAAFAHKVTNCLTEGVCLFC